MESNRDYPDDVTIMFLRGGSIEKNKTLAEIQSQTIAVKNT